MNRNITSSSTIGVAAVAFVLVIAYGWAEGRWSGRWHPSEESRLAAARLQNVPMAVGNWVSIDGDFDERQLALAELDGYLYRFYADESTGDTVQVLVLCGRPGPVSLHTPDVCYRGLGFNPMSIPDRKPLAENVAGGNAECWAADFDKPTPLGSEYLRIGWTWLASDGWHAADQPRLEFAHEPALFKVYLIHRIKQAGSPWKEDAIPRLGKELLPMLAKHLLGDAPAPTGGASGGEG